MSHPAQPNEQTFRLLRYTVASSDMYYIEVEQRDVFLSMDPQGNFRLWAEIVGGGPATAIGWLEMFLEYAMYCCSWCNKDEAQYHMREFAEHLGQSLAKHLRKYLPPSGESISFVINALKQLFATEGVCLTVENGGTTVYLSTPAHTLQKMGERCGLHHLELARYGISTLCSRFSQEIDPHIQLSAITTEEKDEFLFALPKLALS